jgi:hypothetical protein
MVATNAMFPLELRKGKMRFSGWQSCDTATLPEARGKGYFSKCIEALGHSLGEGELFWGFPNEQSKKGFLKQGWIANSTIPLYIRPQFLFSHSKGILRIDQFDSRHSRLLGEIHSERVIQLSKNIEYLNWRYRQHPVHHYEIFQSGPEDLPSGLLVVREITRKGTRFLLLMEILGIDHPTISTLARAAAHLALQKGIHYVMFMGNVIAPSQFLGSGFIRIPNWLLPKRQVLMGQTIGDTRNPAFTQKWAIQTGDWDGF